MLFIVDKNIPSVAKSNLQNYGKVIEFSTENITYPQISNHPDIFFCLSDGILYYAPNTPSIIIQLLSDNEIILKKGNTPVGWKYPHSAIYNAVITERYFIHNTNITDESLALSKSVRKVINIKQGYGRCSLLPLKNDSFITSDRGIFKKLAEDNLDILYVNPEDIVLPGVNHGFFGGTAGAFGNQVFILGSLNYFKDGKKVKGYFYKLGYEVIELYDGSLYDEGSILILP